MSGTKHSVCEPLAPHAMRSASAGSSILAAAAILTVMGVCAVTAQVVPADKPATPPEFDAVSIKENRDPAATMGMSVTSAGLVARKVAIRFVVAYAYGFRRDHVIGGPSWLDSTEYDIIARTNQPNVPGAMREAMVRTMLADRFQLRVHTESRAQETYALVVERRDGRLGPSLTRSTGCQKDSIATSAPSLENRANAPCGTRAFVDNSRVSVEGRGRPIADLVRRLQGTSGRAVVDKTGLTGLFDFALRYTPQIGPDSSRDPGDVPEIFTALREQLGLSLRPEPGFVEMLVIDNVQLPSPN